MRAYSMTIHIPADHRISANFVFGRWWEIKDTASFNELTQMLTRRTKRDKKGRIICSGRPAYDMMSQKRLFVVKMGHDGNIWHETNTLAVDYLLRKTEYKQRGYSP